MKDTQKKSRFYPRLYFRGTAQLCILYPNGKIEVYFDKFTHEDSDGDVTVYPGKWAKSSCTEDQLLNPKAWLSPKFICEIK